MKHALSLSLAIAVAIAAISAPVLAAEDAHHPAAKAVPGKAGPDTARMGSQMKAMNEMHEKMMAAKTPQERDALAAEHMKLMQQSMSMINDMAPGVMGGQRGDMTARHQAMETRMELMRGTMQMMMDRLLAAPAK